MAVWRWIKKEINLPISFRFKRRNSTSSRYISLFPLKHFLILTHKKISSINIKMSRSFVCNILIWNISHCASYFISKEFFVRIVLFVLFSNIPSTCIKQISSIIPINNTILRALIRITKKCHNFLHPSQTNPWWRKLKSKTKKICCL